MAGPRGQYESLLGCRDAAVFLEPTELLVRLGQERGALVLRQPRKGVADGGRAGGKGVDEVPRGWKADPVPHCTRLPGRGAAVSVTPLTSGSMNASTMCVSYASAALVSIGLPCAVALNSRVTANADVARTWVGTLSGAGR